MRPHKRAHADVFEVGYPGQLYINAPAEPTIGSSPTLQRVPAARSDHILFYLPFIFVSVFSLECRALHPLFSLAHPM